MQVSTLRIEGFRSIDELTIDLEEFTSLVGENSSGKSTILQAIDLLLSQRISIDELDFHASSGSDVDTITITATFTDLTKMEQDQLTKLFGPKFDEIVFSREITLTSYNRTSSTAYLMIPQAKDELLNPEYISGSTKSEYHEAVERGDLPEKIMGTDGKGNVGDLRVQIPIYVAEHVDEIEWGDARRTEIKGNDLKQLLEILPEPLYVPAFDRISDHVTPKTTNILGKLLGKIFAEMEEDSQGEMHRLNNILRNLTKKFQYQQSGSDSRIDQLVSLEDKLSGFVQSIMPNSSVRLHFDKPELHEIMASRFEIKLDDGIVTPVERKGHGAQRTMIWSLLRTYLEDLSGKGESRVLFLVEEPELYLHPQAQRVMLNVLRRLADNEQVVYSTHSSVFIDLSEPQEIRLVRKPIDHTQVDTISATTLDYAPNETRFLPKMDDERAELFFAKSVILAEGDTESVLLRYINQHGRRHDGITTTLDELGCQIIITGGKFHMPFYTSLLNDLSIPYFVIYDEDSAYGNHKQINNHIEKNVTRAKQQKLPVRSQVYYPYLEQDWDITETETGRKAENMLELLNNWHKGESYPTKYERLVSDLYDFAGNARSYTS